MVAGAVRPAAAAEAGTAVPSAVAGRRFSPPAVPVPQGVRPSAGPGACRVRRDNPPSAGLAVSPPSAVPHLAGLRSVNRRSVSRPAARPAFRFHAGPAAASPPPYHPSTRPAAPAAASFSRVAVRRNLAAAVRETVRPSAAAVPAPVIVLVPALARVLPACSCRISAVATGRARFPNLVWAAIGLPCGRVPVSPAAPGDPSTPASLPGRDSCFARASPTMPGAARREISGEDKQARITGAMEKAYGLADRGHRQTTLPRGTAAADGSTMMARAVDFRGMG